MVNLDKWTEVEHEQVEAGDRLKIVEIEKIGKNMTMTRVYKGTVKDVIGTEFYLSDGSVWEQDDDSDYDVAVYRRKPKVYEFPKGFGAIISARHINTTTRYELVNTGEKWYMKVHGGFYSESTLRDYYADYITISEGI